MGFSEVADVGFVVGVQFCKACEIVVLHKSACGDVHSVDVGVEIDAAIKSLLEREPGRGDEIFIGARGGRETSMEVVGDVEDVENGYVGREETVEFEDEFGGQGRVNVEMGKEIGGMDTGVGTAATDDGHFGAQESCQSMLDGLLHSRQPWLGLPAVIVGAIICQMNEIAHWG